VLGDLIEGGHLLSGGDVVGEAIIFSPSGDISVYRGMFIPSGIYFLIGSLFSLDDLSSV